MGEASSATAERVRYIAVEVGRSLYGLAVDEVQEVVDMRPLTRVFHAPDVLGGVTNLRGEVLAVFDLGVILGDAAPARAPAAHIVVVRERAGERRSAGLEVNGLAGLREAPQDGLLPLPAAVSSRLGELGLGIIPDPPACVVLSVTALLGSPRLAELRLTELRLAELRLPGLRGPG